MLKKIDCHIFEDRKDWKNVRKGLFTGSRISEIIPGVTREMTKSEFQQYKKENPKGRARNISDPYGISDGADTYIIDLVAALEDVPDEDVQTFDMLRGIQVEPFAVVAYAEKYGYDMESDDFIYTSQNGTVFFVGDNILGATPDVIIQHKKVAQFKCPKSKNHLKYILKVDEHNFKEKLSEYYWQMQTEMLLAEVPEADFVTFDDRFPRKAMQMKVITIPANEVDQKFIVDKARICEERKQEYLNKLPK
jgi:YqaJ-like viral recombinase domain